jgi:hypothetical protein
MRDNTVADACQALATPLPNLVPIVVSTTVTASMKLVYFYVIISEWQSHGTTTPVIIHIRSPANHRRDANEVFPSFLVTSKLALISLIII